MIPLFTLASILLMYFCYSGEKKVQVMDGIVLDSSGGMHGVGLMNVKAVLDKYGGDFAISCDQEKFQAVVIL